MNPPISAAICNDMFLTLPLCLCIVCLHILCLYLLYSAAFARSLLSQLGARHRYEWMLVLNGSAYNQSHHNEIPRNGQRGRQHGEDRRTARDMMKYFKNLYLGTPLVANLSSNNSFKKS